MLIVLWRSARGSLCEQPQRSLLGEQTQTNPDLFDSAPTSPPETRRSERQKPIKT